MGLLEGVRLTISQCIIQFYSSSFRHEDANRKQDLASPTGLGGGVKGSRLFAHSLPPFLMHQCWAKHIGALRRQSCQLFCMSRSLHPGIAPMKLLGLFMGVLNKFQVQGLGLRQKLCLLPLFGSAFN